VRESLEQTKAGLRFKPPKSRAGIRDVTLPAIVTDTLVAQRKRLLEQRLMLGLGKLTDKDLVFPAWDGSPQWPNAFGTAWSRLAATRGLAVSFHELRHTHASQLIDHGVDVVTISKRLGHSSAAITLSVCAPFPEGRQQGGGGDQRRAQGITGRENHHVTAMGAGNSAV
jgi:integrase